jgi:hypothetical protein
MKEADEFVAFVHSQQFIQITERFVRILDSFMHRVLILVDSSQLNLGKTFSDDFQKTPVTSPYLKQRMGFIFK